MYLLYLHRRKSDNIVFYIGIGNNKRPYIKNTRSNFWKNEVKKHDYIIEIISNNLTWENAQEAEIQLISIYGRRDLNLGNLVNLTNGGDGAIGKITSKETKLKLSNSLKGKNLGDKNGMFGLKGILCPGKRTPKYGKDNWMYGKDIFKGSKSKCSKKIVNVITKQIWGCLEDCSIENNIKKTTLAAWLNGQNKNKSNFRYL